MSSPHSARYAPVPDAIPVGVHGVHYAEAAPPRELAEVVHSFWELRTAHVLEEDFHYHALPDACVNLLLDLQDPRVAGITALRTTSAVLPLGRSFHYVGVQLVPGAWCGPRDEIVDHYVGEPYRGVLPLHDVGASLQGQRFDVQAKALASFVDRLRSDGLVRPHPVMARILRHPERVMTVTDMAHQAGLSPRQLQRAVREATGLAPRDLLKVLRLQRSFRTHYLDLYADQAHFTHAFRKATGLTPGQFRARFGSESGS